MPDLPPRKEWAYNAFRWYAVRYVRKQFHAVRLSKTSRTVPETDGPLVVVLNHPSWWDVMIGVVLADGLRHKAHYVPMESEALAKYKFFAKLGVFGVDQGTPKGARQFLRTSEAILSRPNTMLWVTAQGAFRDVRERPIGLQPGVGFLASRLQEGYILPLAIEYDFWEERTPEALLHWGDPLPIAGAERVDGRRWAERIEAALTATQDALAGEAIRRDPALFDNLLAGKAGVGGVYDRWRGLKAWLRGERFDPAHGQHPPEPTDRSEA